MLSTSLERGREAAEGFRLWGEGSPRRDSGQLGGKGIQRKDFKPWLGLAPPPEVLRESPAGLAGGKATKIWDSKRYSAISGTLGEPQSLEKLLYIYSFHPVYLRIHPFGMHSSPNDNQ